MNASEEYLNKILEMNQNPETEESGAEGTEGGKPDGWTEKGDQMTKGTKEVSTASDEGCTSAKKEKMMNIINAAPKFDGAKNYDTEKKNLDDAPDNTGNPNGDTQRHLGRENPHKD